MMRVFVYLGLIAVEEFVSLDCTLLDLRTMFPTADDIEILDVILPQEIITCHYV